MTELDLQLPIDLAPHIEAWRTDASVAFALLGSYARGDAGYFSDVDVVHFVDDDGLAEDSRSFLIERTAGGGRAGPSRGCANSSCLVVRSTATPGQVESWFSEPGQAVNFVAGLREGRPLWDPQGAFGAIRERARRFAWTPALQEKASRLAGQEMVGWIEEVHKGLEGLRRDDTGRLLNARFGLSWGLAWAVRLQRGVLCASDNAFFDDVIDAVGAESEWARLLRRAFGVACGDSSACCSLREMVRDGLLLYCETYELLKGSIPGEHSALIEATVRCIRTELGGRFATDGGARTVEG